MKRQHLKGFTLVEVLIVIIVMGILSTIGMVIYTKLQANVRDQSRRADLSVVQESLERYYQKNGEYPAANLIMNASVDSVKTLLDISNDAALTAPGAANGVNSFTASPVSTPSTTQYGYDANTSCVGNGCLKYTLYYRQETDNTVQSIVSRK